MKVLVVGSGAREHALAWKLGREPGVTEVVCAPGNAGTRQEAYARSLDVSDPAAVLALAETEGVDLTVVGPELPLALGVRATLVRTYSDSRSARVQQVVL